MKFPNNTLKISDFGLAKLCESDSLLDTICGSPMYMAPEIMKFKKYDTKADLWSLGVMFYQMIEKLIDDDVDFLGSYKVKSYISSNDKIHSLLSFFLAIAVIIIVELFCFPNDESNIMHELTNLADSKSSNKL